ncbi:DgyrCDS10779 [Dimorphilus gyrociliatus]|uniref:DgyrCDS10779 n=1 Tax=Dimorphilus gyrociliatus TaxID=2664684 RepID=A0A7I8W2N0_9ANNE|nr:DgyrCDS10779 [Dimorphilus gyrociliatus]
MRYILLLSLLFALDIYTVQAGVTSRAGNIQNCEVEQEGDKLTACGVCSSGRILSKDGLKCLTCPSFCNVEKCEEKETWENENEATICKGCIGGYILEEDKCSSCPTGCRNCTAATSGATQTCTSCIKGYIKNDDQLCSACGSYCETCEFIASRGVSCTACSSQAYIDNSGSTAICKLCQTSIAGCSKCLNKDACSECISTKYALTNLNKCELCTIIDSQCAECDATSGKNQCKKCNDGYFVKENKCLPCPRNCATCAETSGVIKCTKCSVQYTLISSKSCDACPENCLECKVDSGSLICKDDKCAAGYAINDKKLCSKCPDNCNACTYSSSNSRVECNGDSVTHSCTENNEGKSWTVKSDGTCVECPNGCLKCYFKTNDSPTPICYASKCAKFKGFDDETGSCFDCLFGCEYCRKTASNNICQKCSIGYASKYNSKNQIESCVSCSSLEGCAHCEIIDNNLKCLRSPCASKSVNGNNKKFSFSSMDCSGNCPSDSSCNADSIVDENDICYCRSCPAGALVIQAGINAGVCKSCGVYCQRCELTTNKEDVVCKTCVGARQWISVQIGASFVKGCYDCTKARPHCQTLEYGGSPPVCRCKAGSCLGDQSASSTQRYTVLQETSDHQRCRSCVDIYPNALWCNGTYSNAGLDTCRFGYEAVVNPGYECKAVPANCLDWGTSVPSAPNDFRVDCVRCEVGFYLDGGICKNCTAEYSLCTECTKEPSGVICLECSSGVGFDCATPCSSPVGGCTTSWATVAGGGTCLCKECQSTENLISPLSADLQLGSSCGALAPSPIITNCVKQITITGSPTGPGPASSCAKCSSNYALSPGRGTCVPLTPFNPGCKPGYAYATSPSILNCRIQADGFMQSFDGTSAPVQVSSPNLANSIDGCNSYFAISDGNTGTEGRCGGCENDFAIDVVSTSKYTCTNCTANSLENCAFAVPIAGQCKCGRCSNDVHPNYYIMNLDLTGCTKCTGITNCISYSWRLLDEAYVCGCSGCAIGEPTDDGMSCFDCGALNCSVGIKKISTSGCTCECLANQIKRSDGLGCVSCGVPAGFPNCKAGNFKLDTNHECKCSECVSGYVLSADGSSCLSCSTDTPGAIQPNCSTCRESTTTAGSIESCSACDSEFAFSSAGTGSCLACQTGCKKCSVDSSGVPTTINKCTECLTGYALNTQGACIQCPTTPVACSECRIDPTDIAKTVCLQFGCGEAALRDSDFMCETCTIANCDKCVKDIYNKFFCLKCKSRFYQDSNGACQPCTFGCDFCLDGTTCLPNGCKEGYIRDRLQGTCIKCTGEGVARCIYESAQSNTLLPKTCLQGYTLNTGVTPNVCLACDSNCISCDSSGKDKCDFGKCKPGYFLFSGDSKCYETKADCVISVRQNGKTVCQTCNSTQDLSNGECKNCPIGCTSCSFKEDTSKFTCSSCIPHYYKNKEQLCTICPAGCSKCSLNDEGTVECKACLSNYGLSGTECKLCGTTNCNICSPSGDEFKCDSCQDKYYLNNDDCGKCPSNCKECTFNHKYECTKCNDKYARTSDGSCLACPSNCETCSVSSTNLVRCSKCVSSSYSLQSDGTCRSCDDAAFINCGTCGPTPQGGKAPCLSCKSSFTLQDDKLGCVPCTVTGCNSCVHGRKCTQCKKGTYLYNFNRECARKCYQCQGSEKDCGKSIEDIKEETDKIKFVDCGVGECMAYRTKTGDQVTFKRGCFNATCTSENENEKCQTVEGKTECEKCCTGEKCNFWFLDGQSGVNISKPAILLIVFLSMIINLVK